jgi:glutaminyl-peptide cyclotransferase
MKYWPVLFLLLPIAGCKSDSNKHSGTNTSEVVDNPSFAKMQAAAFSSDSAFEYVKKQVGFGPRVPGTTAHKQCADWLFGFLKTVADTVIWQEATVSDNRGGRTGLRNIIASFNPAVKQRILLCAHWDTRPFSDEDPLIKTKPADGANDGGSGVAVLLEISRQLAANRPGIGIDIILFDAEDGGDRRGNSNTWCLGSQYWSAHPHTPTYRARFGILLDMVGAANARFAREGYSLQYAASFVQLIWLKAQALGYGSYFVPENGGFITDDHFYINTVAGIPTIDIIQHSPETQSGFGAYWHTQQDNLQIIDRKTLHAVGHTIMEVIYGQNNSR